MGQPLLLYSVEVGIYDIVHKKLEKGKKWKKCGEVFFIHGGEKEECDWCDSVVMTKLTGLRCC